MKRGSSETGRRGKPSSKFRKVLKCFRSGEQLRTADEMVPPENESIATKDHKSSESSSRAGEATKKLKAGNIEEAESSLRESGCLNYEEARALLGRYEYQKGNIEAALHVFEAIDIGALTPKIKITLARGGERRKRRSQSFSTPPLSMNAVTLLLEAIFLKAKSLEAIGRFKEAAQSCKVVLDIVESSFPDGLPQNFGADCKLQEIISKNVELLPELWKLSDCLHEAILSYRRALLHNRNLEVETTAKIQKDFAVLLLYSGCEASAPKLRFQMDSSFIPRNSIEEAILLLMILLRKVSLQKIQWDPSILDHLSFALSVAGDTMALANQVEELLPGFMDRNERFYKLALCYYGAGEDSVALDLLRKLLIKSEDPMCFPALLLASKICGENPSPSHAEEGVGFARRALESLDGKCDHLKSTATCLLGISLSVHSKSAIADCERVTRQDEARQALETSGRMTTISDPVVLYHLSLEYAEQRELDAALDCTKKMLKLEGGCNVRGWLLLTRILSAQKRFVDAETIIEAALDQTGKWEQGELLRTKAKLQIAQGQFKNAIATYTHILAFVQVENKSFGYGKKLPKSTRDLSGRLNLEIWNDLAYFYINLSQWRDAEACLSKSKSRSAYSADRCHATGLLNKMKGLYKESLSAFSEALDIDPSHVPSLISTAVVLRHLGGSSHHSHTVIRSLLLNALNLDRSNHSAWYNLGILYKSQGTPSSSLEAAECFKAALSLEESAPVEPFR
ncbi:hypothetical protein FF1_035646 [Malus domestica]